MTSKPFDISGKVAITRLRHTPPVYAKGFARKANILAMGNRRCEMAEGASH